MNKTKQYNILIGAIFTLICTYFIADNLLYEGIEYRTINENGLRAKYIVKEDISNETAIILVGGGQWGDYWGHEFAKKGLVGLSLPYTGKEGLPKLPEKINLEYFKNAIIWLERQPEVNPDKIVVMGASRNAELALLVASLFPKRVNAVIAFAPSSVSWSNRVLPYNSNDLKPSWTYLGKDIPYVPMDKISVNDSHKIETLEYWKNGLAKTHFIAQATIKVEKISGPIILFSGNDDEVWPSSYMADMIEKRLVEYDFKHSVQNIKFDRAGHLISSHPETNPDNRVGQIRINGKNYEFEYGGTPEGDEKARNIAKIKLMEFLEKI